MAGPACARAAEGEGRRGGGGGLPTPQSATPPAHCAGAPHRWRWEASSCQCAREVHPIVTWLLRVLTVCVSAGPGSRRGQALPEKRLSGGLQACASHSAPIMNCTPLFIGRRPGVPRMTNESLARIIFAESHAARLLQQVPFCSLSTILVRPLH